MTRSSLATTTTSQSRWTSALCHQAPAENEGNPAFATDRDKLRSSEFEKPESWTEKICGTRSVLLAPNLLTTGIRLGAPLRKELGSRGDAPA